MKKLNKGGLIACIVSAFVLISQIFGLSFDSEIVDKIVSSITGLLVIFGIISNNNLGSGSSAEKIVDTLKEVLGSDKGVLAEPKESEPKDIESSGDANANSEID